VRSLWAWAATVSVAWMVPGGTKTPGGNPVIAVPGLTPTSPKIVEVPVLVTVWPPSTANGATVPSPTGGWAAQAGDPAKALTSRIDAPAAAPIVSRCERDVWNRVRGTAVCFGKGKEGRRLAALDDIALT